MGHHADVLGQAVARPGAVDRGRAVLAVALVALAPDGRACPLRLARLRAAMAEAPMLVDLPAFALDDLTRRTLRALARHGPDRVLADAAGLIRPGLAEAALALALRAGMQDGRLLPEMAGTLGGLARRLAVDLGVLADMLAALRMLERPAA